MREKREHELEVGMEHVIHRSDTAKGAQRTPPSLPCRLLSSTSRILPLTDARCALDRMQGSAAPA